MVLHDIDSIFPGNYVSSRKRSGRDGRGRQVALTDRGRHVVDRLMTAHMATEASVLAGLDADEQEQLARLLARLLDHIELPHGHSTSRRD